MNCPDFQSRLTTAIEQRDSAALESLAEHGESCSTPECGALWQERRLLARAIPVWKQSSPIPPARLARNVLQSLDGERPVAGHAIPQPRRDAPAADNRWAVLATAAVILLAVGLLMRPGTQSIDLADGNRSAVTTPSDEHPTLPDVPDPLVANAVMDDPQAEEQPRPDTYVGMAHEASYFVTDLAMLVVPVSVDEPEQEEIEGDTWFSRLGEQLEPVESGVKGKLGEWFGPPAT